MFERFDAGAKAAVMRSQEEARFRGHRGIEPVHLLLGVLHGAEPTSGAGAVFVRLGVHPPTVVTDLGLAIGAGSPGGPDRIPFTDDAKRALVASAREADALGHTAIGAEHVLLGVLAAGTGPADAVVVAAGLDLVRARAAVAVARPHDVTVRSRPGQGTFTTARRPPSAQSPAPASGPTPPSTAAPAPGSGPGPAEAAGRSPDLERVLAVAEQDVLARGHRHLQPEHLLLGVAAVPTCRGALVLGALGLDRDQLVAVTDRAAGRRRRPAVGDVDLSKASLAVLAHARTLAHQLGQEQVGTDHLVYGLRREPSSIASLTLAGFGISAAAVLAEVRARHAGAGPTIHVEGNGDFLPTPTDAPLAAPDDLAAPAPAPEVEPRPIDPPTGAPATDDPWAPPPA